MTTLALGTPAPRLRGTAATLLDTWSAAVAAAAGWRPGAFAPGAFGEPAEEHRGRCFGW